MIADGIMTVHFWLGKLNQFNGDYIKAEMVKAFSRPTNIATFAQ
jgi:hypothetical protein